MNDSLIYISITLAAMAFIVGVNAWNKRKDSIYKNLMNKNYKNVLKLRNDNKTKADRIELLEKDNEVMRRVLNMRTGGTEKLTLVYDAEKSINNMLVER